MNNTILSNSFDIREKRTSVPSSPEDRYCFHCLQNFGNGEQYLSIDNKFFHLKCFNCAQCFNPLLDETYFNFGDKYYCEYDFKRNYAPICQICKNYVMGSVIRTIRGNYHPKCLKCHNCERLIDKALYFEDDRSLCEFCHKSREKPDICAKCRGVVFPEEKLLYRNDIWHAEHFECVKCGCRLDATARIWQDRLYCQRCYDRYITVTCAHCHKVIDAQTERSKEANGKHYHIHHLLCYNCGGEIHGEHMEVDNECFCKACYLRKMGKSCAICGLHGEIIVNNKNYCGKCFRCVHCAKKFTSKSTVMDFDGQPICQKCYERLPKELRKRYQFSS
uniref:LIM zinc-binding domain-containing protein n=1 Tax=Panagrolaimus sp. JU765 TaxID=591449 RepID=A0AC34QHR5_9BILA